LALGFDRKQARVLVQKTYSGAASLQGNSSYEQLISNIASKKGTTEAALKVFANKRLEQIINQAVKAAVKRAKELSHE
jgi:pyrroline-5-carboxylate reductase